MRSWRTLSEFSQTLICAQSPARLPHINMEAPGRVELPTNGLGNRCSIHLSYGANASKSGIQFTTVAPCASKAPVSS